MKAKKRSRLHYDGLILPDPIKTLSPATTSSNVSLYNSEENLGKVMESVQNIVTSMEKVLMVNIFLLYVKKIYFFLLFIFFVDVT